MGRGSGSGDGVGEGVGDGGGEGSGMDNATDNKLMFHTGCAVCMIVCFCLFGLPGLIGGCIMAAIFPAGQTM